MPLYFHNRRLLPSSFATVDLFGSGALKTVAANHPIRFSFHYCGIRYDVTANYNDSKTQVDVVGLLGEIPYSVQDASVRRSIHRVIRYRGHMSVARLFVNKQQRLMLAGRIEIDSALTPVRVVAAATEILLDARALLTLLPDYMPGMEAPPPLASDEEIDALYGGSDAEIPLAEKHRISTLGVIE